MTLGIVVALPQEGGTLTRLKLNVGSLVQLESGALLYCSGAGSANAAKAAEALIAAGADRLISWGCAGALTDALKPGDLCVAQGFIDATGQNRTPSNGWHLEVAALLRHEMSVNAEVLAESKSLLPTQQQKRALHAQSGAQLVDMESLAILAVAERHKLAFVAVRAIADPVTMDLPKAVSQALNEQGEVVMTKLLAYLILHLNEIPGLIALGQHFSKAHKSLREAAKWLPRIAELPLN